MIAAEDPPGFVVRTEAQKAAWDNGFRLESGVESGGWLRYGSTTARGEIWIAGGARYLGAGRRRGPVDSAPRRGRADLRHPFGQEAGLPQLRLHRRRAEVLL